MHVLEGFVALHRMNAVCQQQARTSGAVLQNIGGVGWAQGGAASHYGCGRDALVWAACEPGLAPFEEACQDELESWMSEQGGCLQHMHDILALA